MLSKYVLGAALAASSSAFLTTYNNTNTVEAEDILHPTHWGFEHHQWNKEFDKASARRGFQVFREVCASCHSLSYNAFRHFVDVLYTEKEGKVIAASYEIEDGPNDEGEMFMRPGKLTDYFPSPYSNENAARAMNNGALPPDLSLICKARHAGEDYIFSLLTGYYEEMPDGIPAQDGMSFNPYFAGGYIAMAPPLMNEQVEYADGTPATVSQMSKDVSTFLAFCSSPEQDVRKKLGMKLVLGLSAMAISLYYYKVFRFSVIKKRRIYYKY